jgi:hypothetical protein
VSKNRGVVMRRAGVGIASIAATFAVEDIRAAVELQAGRHVRGKVVIDL